MKKTITTSASVILGIYLSLMLSFHQDLQRYEPIDVETELKTIVKNHEVTNLIQLENALKLHEENDRYAFVN